MRGSIGGCSKRAGTEELELEAATGSGVRSPVEGCGTGSIVSGGASALDGDEGGAGAVGAEVEEGPPSLEGSLGCAR